VLIDGTEMRDRLGATAYMPQHDALLEWRRVIDNVGLSLQLQGVGRREARRRAVPLLERFGLGEFTRAWPWQLSGGMRQRVAFLRTVIADRPLLLLDEPFGALDEMTRDRLNEELLAIRQVQKFTAFFVTHSVTEAVFLSSRIVVLAAHPGRIVRDIPVPFPYPRTAETRESPDFQRLVTDVSRALRTVNSPPP
jgi:NitT/TauT family transport system ATP-binding protein